MATRYWVGGTGSWDTSTTTNWSATSGGPGGASAPTSADDVIFNASSGSGTASVNSFAYAKSITFSSSSVAFTGAGFLFLYGNVTIQSATNYSFTGFLLFYASGTLISGGKTLSSISTSGTSASTLTLGDALNTSGNISVGGNDLFVSGGFNINSSGLSTSFNGASANLGASTITLSAIRAAFSVGAATTATTSSANIVFQNGGTFNGGGKSYRFVDNTANSGGYGLDISGTNTFSRLTLAPRTTAGNTVNLIADNQTITTFVCSGTAVNTRISILGLSISTNIRSNITLTVGTWTTKSDVDFLNVTAAGASAPWSGTRLGNCGNNSNISFAAGKTVYWNLAGAALSTDTGWATTSGGTPAAANFPLPQDTAVIDNNSAGTSIQMNSLFGAISASTRTSSFSINFGFNYCTGNWNSGSGITLSGGTGVFCGSNQTFTYSGPASSSGFVIGNSQTFTFGSGFSTTGSISLNPACTLNTANYNITSGSFTSSNGNNVLALGSSTFTVTGGFTGSATTSTTGTGVIRMSSGSAKTFAGAGGNYSAATLDQGGAGNLTITGANSFANITNSYGATGAATIIFPSNTTTTLGNFTASGTVGKLLTLQSSTAGTRATLSDPSGTISISYASLKDLNATGGAVWNAFTSNGNVDAGNNLGWIFVSPAGGNFLMFF